VGERQRARPERAERRVGDRGRGLVAGLAQQLGYWPNRAKALGPKNVKIPGRSNATSDQEHQDRVLIGSRGIVGRKKKIT